MEGGCNISQKGMLDDVVEMNGYDQPLLHLLTSNSYFIILYAGTNLEQVTAITGLTIEESEGLN